MRRQHHTIDLLTPWAKFHGIIFNGITVVDPVNEESPRGAGIVAVVDHGDNEADAVNLLTVPKILVLSMDLVHDHAKVDRHLRELLEAVADLAKVGI